MKSVAKTGRLIAIDSASRSFSVASEIISTVVTKSFKNLKTQPIILALRDGPSPTSFGLTDSYYFGSEEIYKKCLALLNISKVVNKKLFVKNHPHDVPGDWFQGPF